MPREAMKRYEAPQVVESWESELDLDSVAELREMAEEDRIVLKPSGPRRGHCDGTRTLQEMAEQARGGGWRSIATMKRSYQHADDVGVLEAVLEPRNLREPRKF